MKKNIKKYILSTFFLLAFALTTPALASEITGTISTGVETGINGMVVVKPTANPEAGTYGSDTTPPSPLSVVLTGGAGTVSIRYTTDGSAATCTSTVYSAPIVVSSSLVIEAISCYPNGIDSGIIIFGYAITESPPAPAPAGGGGGGGGGGRDVTPETSNLDFNEDKNIDIFDFNILMVNWGTSSGAVKATGDADGDGDVDIFDFNLLIINWQS